MIALLTLLSPARADVLPPPTRPDWDDPEAPLPDPPADPSTAPVVAGTVAGVVAIGAAGAALIAIPVIRRRRGATAAS